MGTALKITIALIVLLLLASIYPAVYLYSLNTVDAEKVEFSEISISSDGITLSGTMVLRNDGAVAVTVDHLRYTITLENTDEELGNGLIGGAIIPAGGTAEVQFTKTLGWKPSVKGVQDLLRARAVNLVLSGEATATFLGIPFSREFSVKLDVKQYLQNYARELLSNPAAALQQLGMR